MKAVIKFNLAEHAMVVNAMKDYMKVRYGVGKKLLGIALDKVSEGRTIKVDGMEMIFIEQALHLRAKRLLKLGKREEYKHYVGVADLVTVTRKLFQSSNNPLKKKEAPTAATVDAS